MALSYRDICYFVAGTSRFNSANEATIKIGVMLSPQPHAPIQAGLNPCVGCWSQRRRFLIKLLSPTCPCVMPLQSVVYYIPTSKNIRGVSFKLCLIAPATCKKYSGCHSLSPSAPPEQKPHYHPTSCREGTTGI